MSSCPSNQPRSGLNHKILLRCKREVVIFKFLFAVSESGDIMQTGTMSLLHMAVNSPGFKILLKSQKLNVL